MLGEITAKPIFAILVTIVTYILKVIGFLSPVLAGIGLFFGAIAAIYSWQIKRLEKKGKLIELEKDAVELKVAQIELKKLEGQ